VDIYTKGRERVSREIEILREEYKRAIDNPLFDDPEDYCVLLDLIRDRINQIEIEGEDNE
jgi:cobalamin biosynthesis Co2+ chelatase CbiK